MRSNTLNYTVVGAFVLAMLVGLVVAIALLTGRTGATDSYYAVYDNVTGVKFGTQILYEGYPIGQVEEVIPVEEGGRMRFRVDMGVTRGWRIPDDSVAQIAAPGLLSAITISITAGRSASPLAPGGKIKERESANIFAVMSSVADDVRRLSDENVKPLLDSLTGLLQGDAQVLIKELTGLAQDMSRQLPQIATNVDEFTTKMNATSDEIQALFRPESRRKIEGVIDSVDAAARDFGRLANELSATRTAIDDVLGRTDSIIKESRPEIAKTLSDTRYVMDSVARRIDAINQNLEGASRNMYEFSRQIRQNPGLLLGSTPPRDDAGGGNR